ncbi:MAG: hypothetical protein K6U80_04805 [Firmicutes bacterium]|nr:hypothetical protein [Bacillota bacterium]
MGTVVGAGFASGQEILQFFGFHGRGGVWGIILSTVLFVLFGTIIFLMGKRLHAVSHLEVVRESGGSWIGRGIDYVITFFLFGAFTAMAAGSGALFQEQYGIPHAIGSLVMIIASVATVLSGIRGVLAAIGAIAPVLAGSVLIISILALFQRPVNWFWSQPQIAAVPFWPLSAVAYASYNIVLAAAVLAPAGRMADEASLRQGALYGGLGLGLGALAIHLAILTQVPRAAGCEIPMLFLARNVLGSLAPLYSVILLAEVYTTAAGSLYGFVARMTGPNGPRFIQFVIVSGLAGFIGSLLGFSNLVAKLYSAVGYAGFILLITLIRGYYKHFR